MADDRTFQCILIAPSGKLLDCRTGSAVFPAHDGQVGVMTDHMPMFCKLGLGIMEVKTSVSETQAPESLFFLMDGGFAMVCANLLKVVSYEVVSGRDTKPEAIEHLRASLTKQLEATTMGQAEHLHLTQKLSLLNHLMELSGQTTKVA
jgi:F0F1-type ATP synthase epsilon subunit